MERLDINKSTVILRVSDDHESLNRSANSSVMSHPEHLSLCGTVTHSGFTYVYGWLITMEREEGKPQEKGNVWGATVHQLGSHTYVKEQKFITRITIMSRFGLELSSEDAC